MSTREPEIACRGAVVSEGARHACGIDEEIGRRLADSRLDLPMLPAVASAVLTLLDDPDADAASIASAIRNDQVLAGHVMKYANSPLVRVGAPVVSLQQAISRLGIRRVGEVALVACLGPKLFKAPRFAGVIDALWRESLATALWARDIARTLRRNVEVSFLCGLLHQIGAPIVLDALQHVLGDGGDADLGAPDEAVMTRLLARHGAAAGQLVARHWALPEPVCMTIAHVHDFRAAPQSTDVVAMVAVARAFAQQTPGDAPADIGRVDAADAMAEINLYRTDAAALLAQVDAVRKVLREIAL